MLKKETKEFNGQKMYLIGKTKDDNKKMWLVAPSWDCGWYWGFGYMEQFNTRNSLIHHTHFDSIFFNNNKNSYDIYKEYFTDTTLTDNEKWILLDLMKSFYTLRTSAGVFKNGNSHYTSKTGVDLKNEEFYNTINQQLLPQIFERIDNLLKGE